VTGQVAELPALGSKLLNLQRLIDENAKGGADPKIPKM
tara:strand:- start:7325 stop:7438 length:114 start_codon:yes stop_codon:yes gene_type:complete